MNEGWIMLHRKLLDDPIIQRPKYCHLWIVLLLKAQHKRSDFIWDNQRQTLQPGQLITGRKQLSQETRIPESTIERILKYLESEHQIGQQTTPKFRIITIKNWEKYQSLRQSGQQTDNKRTTDGQQMDTYNNDKNANNDNKYSQNSDEFQLSKLLLDLILERKPDFKKPSLAKWSVHIDRLLRLDGRDAARVEEVIRWCQKDSFWQNNILSTEKLRKHFDQLELQMDKPMRGNTNGRKNRKFNQTSSIGETINA